MAQLRILCLAPSQRGFTSVMRSMMRLTKKQRHLMKSFLLLLCIIEYYAQICKCKYLLQETILLPHKSPWHQLMDFWDPTSFLLMTRLTCKAFVAFHNILQLRGIIVLRGKKGVSGHCPLMHSSAFCCFTWAAQ